MTTRRVALLACLLTSFVASGRAAAPAADFLLTSGHVWTGDPAQPWAEAVAVQDGRIVYVGPAAGAEAHRGPATRVVDAGGRLVTPGFNDSHIHLMGGALSLERVDLIVAESVATQRMGAASDVRLEDVPFDAASGEVVVTPGTELIRHLPAHLQRMRLVAVDANGERVLGDYTFNHSPS